MDKQGIEFRGYAAEYFGIWIVNLLLSIITLGIYSAWAKVRTKQYMYGNTLIDNDPFHYLATPIKILIGRIVAVVAMIIWIGAQAFSPELALIMMLIFFAFFPILVVKNMRFDMRMTQFRNIRFNFVGKYKQAYWVFLAKPFFAYLLMFAPMGLIIYGMEQAALPWLGLLLLPLFLLVVPWLSAWVIKATAEYTVNNCRYGNLAFAAELESKVYFKILLKTGALFWGILVALALIAAMIFAVTGSNFSSFSFEDSPFIGIGLIMFLYLAMFPISLLANAYLAVKVRNYVYGQTQLDKSIQLHSTMRTRSYFMLLLTNLLLLGLTWGLATPMVHIRRAKYFAKHTQLSGDLGLTQAKAVQLANDSSIADEMGDAFDLDIGVI